MTEFKYRAFISYSWKDRPAVEALHRALEAFRTPKALRERAGERLTPIFRDRDEEAAGANLKAAIEEALDASDYLIVACSPNSANSPWVNKEIAYFRKKRDPSKVLCYVVSGEPGPAIFPPALIYETSVDGDVTADLIEAPLAADAREEGDGVRVARLKIVAAMLGVGLDTLVRRDAQRRAQRMRVALGAASAIALGFAGVAAFAVVQRNEAVANAERARREALKAERTAEFMVSLFEVVDPGEARGREVTAKEILDKGVKSIEADLAEEPDVQGTLMHTMGRVYTGLGLYPDAARILGVARDKRAAIKADPADVFATESALARAEFEKGDLDAAKALYAKLVAEAEADLKAGKWRVDFASALIGMGETTLYAATPEEAQGYYERARDLLAAHGMAETREGASALRGIGVTQTARRQFDAARETLIQAVAVARELSERDRPLLSGILSDLANVEYRVHRLETAEKIISEVLAIDEKILGKSHPDYLISANNLARYKFEGGELGAAKSVLTEVLKHEAALSAYFGPEFSYFINTMGEIEASMGDWSGAIGKFRQALLIAEGPKHRLFPVAMINLGASTCIVEENDHGLEKIREGRKLLADHYAESDWRFAVADEFESRCLVASSRAADAIVLAKTGYDRLRSELGDDHYFTRRAKSWLGSLQMRQRD